MSKLTSGLRLLFRNPKRFWLRLRNEMLAPTTGLASAARGVYTIFALNKLTSLDRNKGRYLFVYDTLLNPITFDFLHYLYYVNWMRQRLGLEYIDILIIKRSEIIASRESSYISAIGSDNLEWRLVNLVIPLARLFVAVGRVSIVDPVEAFNAVKNYTQIYPEGYSYASPKPAVCRLDQPGLTFKPELTISATAREIVDSYFSRSDCRQIVTITLRSYDYISCRNSDIASWVEFAKKLDPAVFRVIFVPDASVNGVAALPQLTSCEVFDSACWNLELRAALYERAWMNMGVACGPLAISGLLDSVWTVMIDRSLDYPEEYYRNVYSTGVVPGQPPNFYSRSCHMFLAKDDAQTISNIFSKYVGRTP